MPSQCLSCHAEIDNNIYGLTQCPSCHTFVFIDFEGNVQKQPPTPSDSEEFPDEPEDHPKQQINESHDMQPVEDQEQHTSSASLSPLQEDISSSQIESEAEQSTDQDKNSTTSEDISPEQSSLEDPSLREPFLEEPSLEQSPLEEASLEQASQENPPLEDPPTLEQTPSQLDSSKVQTPKIDSQPSNPIQEVTDYANASDVSDSDDFYYNVTISGIDSKRLREEVLDVLNDKRFGWTQEDTGKLIQNGCLKISKFNPAKTYILISQLKLLPLKIQWDQVLSFN